MATPVLPGTSGLECTVIVGPEFQCSASPNGSITIQTNTGPIIIFLHRIADQRRIQINPVHQQRIPVVPFLSETSTSQTTFWFAENSGSADTQQENSNDLLGNPFSREQRNAEAFNSTANELEEGIHASLGGDEYTYHSVSSSGSFKKISSGKRSKPLSSDEELKEFCRKLSTKTLEQWKSRHKDDQSLKVLLSDWNTIFGQINYSSPGQWSYQTIIKAETLGGLHLPFHKMILATWWNSCLERRTSEVTARIKKQMVLALEPGFDSFDAKVQDSKRKQIDRCILQGNVITLMFNRAPGLVITAARSIKTTEYEILWKNKLHPSVSMLDWLSEELIKDSQLYLEPVLTILHFLSKIFNIQPQSPNPQANFSLPQSRIEPESQTDAASSSCRAIHSLKEPVPSYQISLCGQQPSEDSIETIANTAKRRKISSNICLQSPKVCPILIPESNGGTTQEESQHYSTDPSIHREHYNLAPLFEGASNSEHERVSPTSLVETRGDLLPISEDIEVGQWSAISSVNRADYDKDTNLPSYGLSDLLGHVETSYCFGKT